MFKDTREPPINTGNQRGETNYDRSKIINLAEYRLSRQQAAGVTTETEPTSPQSAPGSNSELSPANIFWQRIDSLAAITTGFVGGGVFLGIGVYGGNPAPLAAGLTILGLAGFTAIDHWREHHR